MGRRLGATEILHLGGCGAGLARGLQLLGSDSMDIEVLDALADSFMTKAGARFARVALGMMGDTPYLPHHADLFTYGGDPIHGPAPLEPDNLSPYEARYGDSASDGSGASFAR